MPLPSVKLYGATQCAAQAKRSRSRCQNPAAYGMPVCRYHGARKSETIRYGQEHPNYKSGRFTAEAKREYQGAVERLNWLKKICIRYRLFLG